MEFEELFPAHTDIIHDIGEYFHRIKLCLYKSMSKTNVIF